MDGGAEWTMENRRASRPHSCIATARTHGRGSIASLSLLLAVSCMYEAKRLDRRPRRDVFGGSDCSNALDLHTRPHEAHPTKPPPCEREEA